MARPRGCIWGNRVSPRPSLRGGLRPPGKQPASGEGLGGCSPPRRQLASGEGLGGRSPPKNNNIFIPALCGAAAWMTDVKTWGNPVSPSPCLWGRQALPTGVNMWGNPVSPSPCLWEQQALPEGRVWEGAALPGTNTFILSSCARRGKTRFPLCAPLDEVSHVHLPFNPVATLVWPQRLSD